jgi:hypothetical protein
MINEIGDALAQPAVRSDQIQVEQVKAISQQEAEKKVHDRPVEKSEEQDKAKLEEKKDRSKTRYTLHGNKVVFEKYSKDGNLVLQLPPVHEEEV